MSRFVSYLVRPVPFHATAGEIVERMRSLYPHAAESFGAAGPDWDMPLANVISVAVGEHVVVIEPIAVPLPAAAFNEAASADTEWPEAAAALGSGSAYVVVSLRNPAVGHGAAVKGALAVTMVLCALRSLGPSIGAVWSQGATIADQNRLARIAEMLAEEELPALFWAGVNLGEGIANVNGERTTMGITTGLAPFVDREFEFLPATIDRHALELLLRFLCVTLIRDGHVLRDRETYVLSETETLRVTFATNSVGRVSKVMKLFYQREVPHVRKAAPDKDAASGRRPVFGRRGAQSGGR